MRVCCRGQNKMKQKHSVTFDTILEPQLGQRWTFHKNVYVNKRNVHLNICHRLQKQILSRCVKNMTHADNWTNRWRVFYTFQYVYVQHDLFNNLFLSCYVTDKTKTVKCSLLGNELGLVTFNFIGQWNN